MPTVTTNRPHRRPPQGRRVKRPSPLRRFLPLILAAVILITAIGIALRLRSEVPSWVDVQLVRVNGSGRRGEAIGPIHDIAIHYVGNPGTTAQQNRDFYNNPDTQVSSHFLIGLKGEIIQCVPLKEKSSATNERNRDTISIEVCHPDAGGVFTDASYQSLVKLTAWLCDNFHLSRDRVIRHYDVTEKNCPKYFVENEDAWKLFKADVDAALKNKADKGE